MNIAANLDGFAVLDDATGLPAQVPVLIIWGEQNRVLPAGPGRRLCDTLGPARTVIVPGGHLAMLEHPATVIEAIESFLPATGVR